MRTPDVLRALIVEDDPLLARSVARRLLQEGYTVSLANSCKAARTAGSGFRVAVLDLDLPDGSGSDLADELLREGAVGGVVFYTGSLDMAQRRRAERFGVLIDKSRNLEDVIVALEPVPTAPPVSQMAPSPHPRGSGSRFVRVQPEEDASPAEAAASSRQSSRR